jgi:hypothetical protein
MSANTTPVSKKQQIRQERQAAARRRNLIYGAGAIVLVVVVMGGFWYATKGTANCASLQDPIRNLYTTLPKSEISGRVKLLASPYGKPLPAGTGVEEEVPDEGAKHVTVADIPYQHIPPASGPHYDTPAQWEFNTSEVPEGTWVHNLEHGGLVLLYQCDTGRMTMLAWNHMLPLDGFDQAKIAAFYNKYVDQGPEKAP